MSPDEALRIPPLYFLRLRFSSFDSPTALSDDDIHISHRAVKWLVRALTLSQNSMIMLRGAPGVGATKVEGSIGLSFIGIFVEGAQSVQIPEDAMVPDGVAAVVQSVKGNQITRHVTLFVDALFGQFASCPYP